MKKALKVMLLLTLVAIGVAFVETLYYGPRPKDRASSIINELAR